MFSTNLLLNRAHLSGYTRFFSDMAKGSKVKTCGIIVIGDEILKGEVKDTNSAYITPKLYNMGIQVEKISIIGDVVEEISKEVKEFSSNFHYVITSGGIGPTHDDVTFEGVARAFNKPIVLNQELVKLCSRFYGTTDVDAPGMKLAKIPESSKITYPDERKQGKDYPNICLENVYMFPGIPQLFEYSFDSLSSKLFHGSHCFYTKSIFIDLAEDCIASDLYCLTKMFPDVVVGCYPNVQNRKYQVRVTLQSLNKESVQEAYLKLLELIPDGTIVNK